MSNITEKYGITPVMIREYDLNRVRAGGDAIVWMYVGTPKAENDRPLYDAPVPAMIEALEMAEDELRVVANTFPKDREASSAHYRKQADKLRALLARIKGGA